MAILGYLALAVVLNLEHHSRAGVCIGLPVFGGCLMFKVLVLRPLHGRNDSATIMMTLFMLVSLSGGYQIRQSAA
ncbi:hypothetical protein ACNKHW_26635 [Shigella flexneri]